MLVNDNGNLSILQIRIKMYDMPLADYTAEVAEQLLQKQFHITFTLTKNIK